MTEAQLKALEKVLKEMCNQLEMERENTRKSVVGQAQTDATRSMQSVTLSMACAQDHILSALDELAWVFSCDASGTYGTPA